MASTKAVDRVWALHDFEAENPDEVSFKAGECILVVEKDDEFGDGWWQGTNESGQTGLFPFTYTTLDRSLALSAKSGNATPDALGTPQGVGASAKPGVMHSTMADIDNALTELQSDRKPPSVNGSAAGGAGAGTVGSNPAADASRASFTSERTDADDQSDNFGESDNFASRAIAARAALAANAQKNLANDAEREKQEEQRRRAEAQRQFEEEETRQRQLLLQVEKERQAKLAAGELDPAQDKVKEAPIAGVDMSDESDSEGSVGLLDDFQDKTHSPLFGNLASTPTQGTAAREIKPPTSNLQGIVEDDAAAAKEETPATTSAPASAPLTSNDFASSVQPDADAAASTIAVDPPVSETTSSGIPALPAGAGAIAVGGGAPAALANHERSADASAAESAAVPPTAADDSARSVAGDSTRTGTETAPGTGVATGTATAATSIAAGTNDDAPRSSTPATSAPAAATTAAASAAGSKSPVPASANIAGDPTEWNVDQVVEWARSKGWDEASVVSKFREHEISGDVLLEMDINILKEIDIVAFGKRFQVTNGIKELRSQVPGAVTTPGLSQPGQNEGGLGSPALIAPGGGGPGSASNTPSYSPYNAGSNNGSNADGRSLSARMAETSLDQSFAPTSSRPGSFGGDRDSFGGPAQGAFGGQGFGGPAGVAAWQAQQAGQQQHGPGSRVPSEGFMRGSGDVPLSPTSTSQFGAMQSPRYAPTSGAGGPYDDKLSALPTSPRKRESTGSAGATEKNNRSSFFGLGQRNRKPPPAQAGRADSLVGGPASSVGDDDGRSSKGTLSRLGFARSSRNISSQSSQSNFKDQISLPTSSPHFDSNGDTARRQRQSTGGIAPAPNTPGTPGQAAMGMGMSANARPTSIGSAGPDAPPTPCASAAAANTAGAAADGPVMSRIQPVDLEGWIKKKGERYNSWKPRYLALKGPDLVILRDPRAEKIKGYVNMKGYKVIADENTNPGKYGFKILHETEKPHYFSSEDPILVREWMKALMKSTIGRDHSFPVISSYNNATISLKEAQRMNPPPRPPSPTSRARTQRAKVRPNPEQLTARDAAILMNLTSGQPTRMDDP